MELLRKFNNMVSLLFNGTKACIKINRLLSKSFKVKREVKQSYSLTS